MVLQLIRLNVDVSDDEFNAIFPESIRKFSMRHWTPVDVAKMAAEFLAEKPGAKILDIGSGAGKFCMVGGAATKGIFTGVEQRKRLYNYCVKAARTYHLQNVDYIHTNITEIDFTPYDGFYFYNPFRENIDQTAVIDDSVETGIHLMDGYTRCVYDKLAACKPGTRLATYWTTEDQIPSTYSQVGSSFDGRLLFYKKMR